MQVTAGNTDAALSSSGAAECAVTVTRDGSLNATGADVDSALVGRVPVGSNWGLFGKRKVGLDFFDLLVLVAAVLVDDGLCTN